MATEQVDTIVNSAGTGAPSFTFGFINVTGSANFGSDADTTLVSTDRDVQVFNISASRAVTLPTTGISAGREFVLINQSLFDLVVKSSNGSALTIANSANTDATVQKGYARIRALVATPTTPTQWLVVSAYEEGTFSVAFTSGFTVTQNMTARYKRNNNSVIAAGTQDILGTTTGAPTQIASATGQIPTRLRPPGGEVKFMVKIDESGAGQSTPGVLIFESTGQVDIRKTLASTAFANAANTGYEAGFNGAYVVT